jgi:MarR family transcriptional regulator, organic hydroperoxide resistance regulator
MSEDTALDAAEAAPLGRGFMLWQITNGWQRAIRAALAPTGLTYVQLVLLAGLQDRIAAGTSVSQAGLAQALGADVMMTSQVLRTLEAGGLVRRDRDPRDTRARTLALTEEGEAKLREALPVLDAVDTDFFRVLGHKEDRFAKSLRKLWRKRRLDGMPGADKAEADRGLAQPKPRRASSKAKPTGLPAAAKKPAPKRPAKLEAAGP